MDKENSNPSRLKIILRKLRASKSYRFIKFLATLSVAGFIIFLIMSLNVFYIENITIEPLADSELTHISSQEIEDTLVPLIGERIFSVRPSSVENDLLEQFPFIQDVYVTKRVPDTLVIRISEKNPSVVLDVSTISDPDLLFNRINSVSDPTDMILADDGYVLDTCESRKELCADLPRCAVIQSWGEQPPGSKIYFAELSEIVELDELFSDGSYNVSGYVVPVRDVTVVLLEDGGRVIFSLSKSLDDQFETFEYTIENLSIEGKNYKELDLRYDRPVLRVDKYSSWVTE